MPSTAARSRSSSSAAKPNCTKGFSCKASCIARNRSCRNPLDGQFKTYGEWLQDAVNRGMSLSDIHRQEAESRGVRAVPAPQPSRRGVRELPEGMTVTTSNTYRPSTQYSFEVGSDEVDVIFTQASWGENTKSVSFQVNGSYYFSEAVPEEQRNRISQRVFAALRYHVSQEPDGTEFVCSAANDYRRGLRTLAYVNVGFSRPYGGDPGNLQYAVVRNGRLDPEAAAERVILAEENSSPSLPAYADSVWRSRLSAINENRRREREERRQANREVGSGAPRSSTTQSVFSENSIQ